MPEHRDGTPAPLRDLESFLWRDFSDPECWTAWAAERGRSGQASATSFNDAVRVQQALRTLEAANNGMPVAPVVVQELERAMADHDIRPRLSLDGGLTFEQVAADDPVGYILSLTAQAMIDGAWSRFKLCRDEACRASYFDATRNGTKTWCSMQTCGSKNKMRRLRAKGS